MNRIALLLLLVLSPCVLAGEAHVTWKTRFTDGPAVAWLTGGDLRGDAFAYGWQGGYDVTPLLNLELSYLYWEDDIESSTLEPLGFPAGGKVNLDNHNLALSARLHFLRRDTWSLYAGGGFSYFITTEEDEPLNAALGRAGGNPVSGDIEVNNEFALHALAGAEVSFSRRWESFVEARYVFADYDLDATRVTRAADGALSASSTPASLPYDHVAARIGLKYRF